MSTKRIVVASTNPVKLSAAQRAFERVFPNAAFEISSVSVRSDVADQPMSDEETRRGAENRVRNAAAMTAADHYVGIEGGIEEIDGHMFAFAWIATCDNSGLTGIARTSAFLLPPTVAELVRNGTELGEADDIVFGKSNSKQANGAIGLLTNDLIGRADYYTEALTLALIPQMKPEHFPKESV